MKRVIRYGRHCVNTDRTRRSAVVSSQRYSLIGIYVRSLKYTALTVPLSISTARMKICSSAVGLCKNR